MVAQRSSSWMAVRWGAAAAAMAALEEALASASEDITRKKERDLSDADEFGLGGFIDGTDDNRSHVVDDDEESDLDENESDGANSNDDEEDDEDGDAFVYAARFQRAWQVACAAAADGVGGGLKQVILGDATSASAAAGPFAS